MPKKKTPPAAPSAEDKLRAEFQTALAALRDKFPMVYVEAWTPEDFDFPWESASAGRMVEVLRHRFDANHGTNWAALESAKEEVQMTVADQTT